MIALSQFSIPKYEILFIVNYYLIILNYADQKAELSWTIFIYFFWLCGHKIIYIRFTQIMTNSSHFHHKQQLFHE